MKKNNKSKISGAAMGATVAAVGAGAYYLLGPDAKKHQKKAKALMLKMQKEVVKKAAKAQKVTKPIYHEAVDTLASTYSKEYKIHEKEIKAFAKKLKSEWKNLKK